MTMINNIKAAYGTDSTEADRGDVVQFILIVAAMAIVVIVAMSWIGDAVLNKGADVAECVEGSNTYNSASSQNACESADHSASNSFKNKGSYQDRY